MWGCAFAPSTTGSETEGIVATCGGSVVCFVDADLGKVIRKYTHEGEDFCDVAWTVLPTVSVLFS